MQVCITGIIVYTLQQLLATNVGKFEVFYLSSFDFCILIKGWNMQFAPIMQGSDCVHPFVALQSCIKANPDAFSKDILGKAEDESKELEPVQEYKILPPKWSRKPQSPKSRL